jgi:hypothetical protein
VAVALLSISPPIERFLGQLDVSGPMIRVLGDGGYQILAVLFFAAMAAVLYKMARKPLPS